MWDFSETLRTPVRTPTVFSLSNQFLAKFKISYLQYTPPPYSFSSVIPKQVPEIARRRQFAKCVKIEGTKRESWGVHGARSSFFWGLFVSLGYALIILLSLSNYILIFPLFGSRLRLIHSLPPRVSPPVLARLCSWPKVALTHYYASSLATMVQWSRVNQSFSLFSGVSKVADAPPTRLPARKQSTTIHCLGQDYPMWKQFPGRCAGTTRIGTGGIENPPLGPKYGSRITETHHLDSREIRLNLYQFHDHIITFKV